MVRAFPGVCGVTRQGHTTLLTGFAAACLPLSLHSLNGKIRLSCWSQPCFSVMVLGEVTAPTLCLAFAAQTSEPLDSQVLNCCSLEHMVEAKLLPVLDCLKTLHSQPWQFRKWVMSISDIRAVSTAETSRFISYLIPAHPSGHWVPKLSDANTSQCAHSAQK